MQQIVRRVVHDTFRRMPWMRPLAFSVIDVLAHPLLYGFRLRHRRLPSTIPAVSSADDVSTFNRAAEDYFRRYPDMSHLERKPFSEPFALSRRLVDIGILIDALRLRPGDTVIELGAGSCWVSHLLNKFGCRTISIDVSETALEIGRRMFANDPATNWTLQPTFHAYDGHTLPVPDASAQAVILYDAFHHLPNPEELLREMRRVLSTDGIAGMSEPGKGHASSAPSRAEAGGTGVLEAELVPEIIAEMAHRAGFAAARCVVAGTGAAVEVDAGELRSFMGGRGFSRYWSQLCESLDSHYYMLLFAGPPEPTTRRPKQLKAVISERNNVSAIAGHVHRPVTVQLAVRNVGNTTWLSAANRPGWTRLGAHLYRDGTPWVLIDYDWLRVELIRDVEPDHTIALTLTLPAIEQAGDYIIAFDLVVEGVTWFADRESAGLDIPVQIR